MTARFVVDVERRQFFDANTGAKISAPVLRWGAPLDRASFAAQPGARRRYRVTMDALRWESRPQLKEPIMLAAFEGWTDAGAAASTAGSYLADMWRAQQFADIDAEEFYDFTALRPQVCLQDGRSREIVWPQNKFLAARTGDRDLVLIIGVEPHLRWRTFSRCVTTVAADLGVRGIFTLGAMLADVAHTRAVPVGSSTADPAMARDYGLSRPQYEGPTGIAGVLQDAFAKVDIPAASLMAQVPHYVAGTPSPKATLAIVERVAQLLSISLTTSELQQAAVEYERQVSEVVAADEDMVRYVRELERRTDEGEGEDQLPEIPSGEALAAELERFLREQDG
jgi:predicted ATP-grasp superfamily ATP-dependent carboligase